MVPNRPMIDVGIISNLLKLGSALKGEHTGGWVKLGETWVVVVDDGKGRDSANYLGNTR